MANRKTLSPWWPMCANGCGAPAQPVRPTEWVRQRDKHGLYEGMEPGVDYVWRFCSPACRSEYVREIGRPVPLDYFRPATGGEVAA